MQPEIVSRRRKRYLAQVEKSVTVLFAGSAPHRTGDQKYPFEINRNFFYLTNLDQENMVLVMIKGKAAIREMLFIEEPDPVMALWVGDVMSKEEASQKSGIAVEDILYLKDLNKILSSYLQVSRNALYGEITNCYLDLERRQMDDVPLDGNRFAYKIRDNYPHVNIHTCYNILANMRLYKDKSEVEEISKAIAITNKAILKMMDESHADIYEYELESHFDQVLKANNTTVSFKSIAAGGKNATILHYEDNNCLIKDNELALFDVGCLSNHYASDITRTFPVNGKFTPRQKEIYEIVLEANKKSIEFLKPGVTWQEFHEYGKKILTDGLLRIGKIKDPKEIGKYYYHSLGHSLGLDVHDVGHLEEPIREGIVVTVEPGLYLADEKIGIRIEDDILITEDGRINLSKDIIKEVSDIEKYMSK